MKSLHADGLRGLAALNVVTSHFMAAFTPFLMHYNYPETFPAGQMSSFSTILNLPIFTILYNGHFAVLIFFVLSGYVLARPYYLDKSHSLKNRLWGRYLRLNLPIAVSLLISFFLYSTISYFNKEAALQMGGNLWLSNAFPNGIDVFQFIKHALYASLLFGANDLNGPLWTLKIEFIGSVLLLGYYIVKPNKHDLITSLIASLFLVAIFKAESIYFISILTGAYLNSFSKPRKPILFLIGIIGLYFGCFGFGSYLYDFLPDVGIWQRKDFYNTIGALLLVFAVINGFCSFIFTNILSQFLGKISFSIYLLHMLVLGSIVSYFYTFIPKSLSYLTLLFITYLFISIAVSVIFERYIDRSSIKASKVFSNWINK